MAGEGWEGDTGAAAPSEAPLCEGNEESGGLRLWGAPALEGSAQRRDELWTIWGLPFSVYKDWKLCPEQDVQREGRS